MIVLHFQLIIYDTKCTNIFRLFMRHFCFVLSHHFEIVPCAEGNILKTIFAHKTTGNKTNTVIRILGQ